MAVPGSEILLHLMELPLFLALLCVQLVDFGLKAPPVLAESLIFQSLFLQLWQQSVNYFSCF